MAVWWNVCPSSLAIDLTRRQFIATSLTQSGSAPGNRFFAALVRTRMRLRGARDGERAGRPSVVIAGHRPSLVRVGRNVVGERPNRLDPIRWRKLPRRTD